jgi:hypothetical protein
MKRVQVQGEDKEEDPVGHIVYPGRAAKLHPDRKNRATSRSTRAVPRTFLMSPKKPTRMSSTCSRVS